MRDENCIFCKLANGDIPTTTLYEDDTFRVIFDTSPATVGHVLITPKGAHSKCARPVKRRQGSNPCISAQ